MMRPHGVSLGIHRQTNSLLRFGVFALSFAGSIIGFLAILGIGGLVLPVLVGSFAGVAFLVLVCWGGSRLLGHLFLGNDPAYQCRSRFRTGPLSRAEEGQLVGCGVRRISVSEIR